MHDNQDISGRNLLSWLIAFAVSAIVGRVARSQMKWGRIQINGCDVECRMPGECFWLSWVEDGSRFGDGFHPSIRMNTTFVVCQPSRRAFKIHE